MNINKLIHILKNMFPDKSYKEILQLLKETIKEMETKIQTKELKDETDL